MAGVKGEPPVSVDCAVVSDGVAWIIVSGGTLTEQSGESVLEAVSNIACAPGRSSFRDARISFNHPDRPGRSQ